jgi:phage tail sheath protein FI
VWGARTLSPDPKWRQVSARRIVSFVTERIRRDAEWVVFEHQRPELWETVSRMVSSRLDSFWNAGLLTGRSAGSDYLVQCDEEMNPPAVRDAGQVHFRVVLRPVSATEYIEVELQLGG